MHPEDNYIETNKSSWNQRVPLHVSSTFYDHAAFLNGKSSLKDIELNLLGDIRGKSILHLQCHFGQDSISLSRLGARVTGVDFSDEAITLAKETARQTGTDTRFICCDLYDLPNHLEEKFDIIFTSYGTIGWLPDLTRWANVINNHLQPGGRFIFVEFHPVLWMFDNDFSKVTYSYFNEHPIIETETGSYADTDSEVSLPSITWNHSMSEVLQNLISQGLKLTTIQEFNFSPYPCFNNIVSMNDGQYMIKGFEHKLPMVYAVEAVKLH